MARRDLTFLLATVSLAAAPPTLPLNFELNQGQAGPEVKFVAQRNGYRLLLTSSGVVLQLAQGTARLMLAGAQPSPDVVGVDKLPGKANYLLGNDPAHWRTSIPTFARVRYRKAYPGVDLVFYGNGKHLEFDFEIAPGADPKVIRLAFEGETQVNLNGTGDLVLSFGQEQIQLRRPTVYQGKKRTVEGRYRLKGRHVAFEVGEYDRTLPLVIDPVLEYSTFLGGRNGDGAAAVAVDRSANVYVTGHTRTDQPDFPLSNPMQATAAGQQAAFMAKLNSTGTELVYSTYLGGLAGRGWSPCPGCPLAQPYSSATGIAVDAAGNAYVTGITTDSDFPTRNPAQRLQGGAIDAFVAKLNAFGTGLVYSTFLGGPGNDFSRAIAVDRLGRAYVVGNAGSNFPAVSALQPPSPNQGPFVARLNSAGTAFEYSTHLGGGANARGIAVDLEGNAYITGSTSSAYFPVTNALQEHPGVAPVYRTTNGGSRWERAYKGLPTSPRSLVVDPHSPSTLYAVADGLYRSIDGGESWRAIPIPGVMPYLLTLVVIDPTTPNTLYVSSRFGGSVDPPPGLYKSIDGGATWREIWKAAVSALAIDPSNPSTLYAAQTGSWNYDGVWKSYDGGGTWSRTSLVGNVGQLFLDSQDTLTLYAVWNEWAEFRNVLVKSTDGGENWSRTGADTWNILAPVVYDRQSRVFYASTADAILKSSDGGAAWVEIYRFARALYSYGASLTLGPGEPAAIYAGTPRGVIKSTDGGKTWSETGIGMPSATLAAHPSQAGVVYAGPQSGGGDAFLAKMNSTGQALIYATYLGGSGSDSGYAVAVDSEGSAYVTGKTNSPDFLGVKTFQPPASATWWGDAFVMKVNPAGSAVVYAKALGGAGDDIGQAIAVDDAGNAFIAGQTFSGDFPTKSAVQAVPPGPLYRSGDGGANWSDASKGLLLGEVRALAVHPSAPLTLYAGGYGGVSKSEDGGATWKTALADLDIETLALDPRAPATVWAGGLSGVFRSTDGGATWGRADLGLPGGLVKALVVDPEQSSTVYAGAEGGIFKTTDAGKNWALINRTRWSRNDIYALSISSTTPPVLYAVWGGYYSSVAYKSVDRGATWTSVNLDLYVDGSPGDQIAVAVDPSAPSTIYAASPYEILKSTDGGSKWTRLRIPLDSTFPPSCSPQSLVMARSQPATLYVGGHRGDYWNSEGDCVLRSTDGGESWNLESGPGGTTIWAMAVGGPGILYAVGEEGGQAFATKLDPRGDVVFSTFLGGRSIDSATGIAVDPSGGVWVAGFTMSSDFPTQKPFQGQLTGSRSRYGGGDAFLLRIKE